MALVALVVLGYLDLPDDRHEKLFSKKATLYTYMDDSAALAPSSPVRINGIIAGKVKKVALSGETEPRRIIRVDMEVERDLLSQIPVDSIASISAENVLGAKFINIKKVRIASPCSRGRDSVTGYARVR